MICGISDLSVISEDGYLILPSEGCRGIAAGAFASCKDIISEIYIPANISEIEERAFTDLTSLGWIEMETPQDIITEDGVYFQKTERVFWHFLRQEREIIKFLHM